jgi:transcriptional regulator with XRE-family HTH domain
MRNEKFENKIRFTGGHNMKNLSRKIKYTRILAGLDQEQLGKLAGVSRRSVSDYENERAIPREKTLSKLAMALNVTPEYLTDVNAESPEIRFLQDEKISTLRGLFGNRCAYEKDSFLKHARIDRLRPENS